MKYIVLILVLFITSCATVPEKTVTKKEALLCQVFADYLNLEMTMCKEKSSPCYKPGADISQEILFFAAACQNLLPRCEWGKK